MISHKHKCIFIHIPKSAGTSIYRYFFPNVSLDYKIPNYEIHYGWCPKRKLHMQHANLKELLDLELITPDQANSYFKFTFVRNPYDRIFSDYLWMRKTTKVHDTFKNYILKEGRFRKILNDSESIEYRGDHLRPQKSYLNAKPDIPFDYVGKFENFLEDIEQVLSKLNICESFNIHENKRTENKKHYSYFYSKSRKALFDSKYPEDKDLMDYSFFDKKNKLDKNVMPYFYYDWLIERNFFNR